MFTTKFDSSGYQPYFWFSRIYFCKNSAIGSLSVNMATSYQ